MYPRTPLGRYQLLLMLTDKNIGAQWNLELRTTGHEKEVRSIVFGILQILYLTKLISFADTPDV